MNGGLDINIDKTKVVVFNRAFRKTHKFSFFVNNSPIEVAKSYRYLGVTITSTGSFHLNMQEVRNKALRALYSLYSSISLYSGEGTISLFLKLFKILIKPILLYACEIWGFTTFTSGTIISKFVGKFYKNLLGVPISTSNVAGHLELGCLPVEIDIKESILKYWLRLVQLPSNRLVHHAYQFLLQNNISDSWMSAVRNIFNHTGYSFIWDEQNDLSFHDKMFSKSLSDQISESMMNQFIQTSDRCMFTERKLNYFSMFKEDFGVSKYIECIPKRSQYTLMAKCRLGVLDLEIEKGRWENKPREERLCQVCPFSEIEDEAHFMFSCGAYEQQRATFLQKIDQFLPNFQKLPDRKKYITIMKSTDSKVVAEVGKFLLQIHKIREEILNPN